jgi:hypothetical protein
MAVDSKRGRREKAPPAEEPVLEAPAPVGEVHGKTRGRKGGGGFPGMIPLAAGILAAVLAFVGVQMLGQKAIPQDPYESLDAGGIQAARLLGALDLDRWKGGTTTSMIRRRVKDAIEEKRAEAASADAYERDKFDQAIRLFMEGDNSQGAKWRPGLNMIFPENDPDEAKAKQVLDNALHEVQKMDPGAFLGAMVREGEAAALVLFPTEGLPASPTGKQVPRNSGETKIYETKYQGQDARWYEHPMRNRLGEVKGSAVVILSTASVKHFSIMPIAAAGAGLAFLGGLLGALLLSGGPKKALSQLHLDAENLGRGILETRVHVQGPWIVQAIAKNLQKLAALAKSGVAAPAQIVVQEVVHQPVTEVNESLAPLKSFQRPDELECEATQKLCGEVGSDYFDIVNVDEDHVGAFIADIPVRGVKSAMYMAQVRALFRSHYKGKTSPAEVLKAINRGFAPDLPRGVYVTAMYAIIDRKTGLTKVANAQHLPLIFYKMAKKGSARLQPEGIALGLDPGPVFDKTVADKAVQLDKGDRIVLYTDGAINAKNAAGAQYGEERFSYVVNREAPKNSAACVNFVANDVDLFHEGAPLLDDFTLLTIRKTR